MISCLEQWASKQEGDHDVLSVVREDHFEILPTDIKKMFFHKKS